MPRAGKQARSAYLQFSQVWFPTVQEVLHADWQDVWHSPHPPFLSVFCNFLVFNVFTCFIRISPLSPIWVWPVYPCYYSTADTICKAFLRKIMFYGHFASMFCLVLQTLQTVCLYSFGIAVAETKCSDDAAQHTQHTIDDMCLGKRYRLSLRHMKSYQ